MAPLNFLPCTIDDLEALQSISIITFRAAFESQNNPDDFHIYLQKAFSLEKLSREMQHSEMHFFFVKQEEELIAYFKINTGHGQSEPESPEAAELERIYVLPQHVGSGVGSMIINHIQAMCKSWHKRYLWLGVWEHNEKAIRFYERHGFIKFAEHPYYVGSDKQTDWMMKYEF
ncbi:MAG: hypothetical protein RLZZ241_1715 [Bacteroidota bacterium]|jgi:ribosomal protein S18 acetylase RimI-like enzyme